MKIIEQILHKAETRAYTWIVFFMTICESVFLFIPPEIFMTPAIIANKKKAIPITVAATLGSIIGGTIAYFIGFWLYDSLGTWLINVFSDQAIIDTTIKPLFDKYGILIIILTAVTPIPYKILGIWLGFIHYPILLFLGVSAIFRTGRFAIFGFLLWKFQKKANELVKKYSWQITITAIILTCLGCVFLILFR